MSEQDKSFQALRLIVIAMGVVLLAGSIFLIGATIKKFNQKPDDRACKPAELKLGKGETYELIETEGKIVTLLVRNPKGADAVRRVNLCTGKIKAELVIKKP